MRNHGSVSIMSSWFGWAVLGVGAWALLPACGGSSSGDSDTCRNISACGGDVVGSWRITSSCITVDTSTMMPNADCPGQTTRASDIGVSGNFTFNADGTYDSTATVNGNVIVGMPATCLTRNGITFTCAQLEQGLDASLPATFSSASCVAPVGGGCSCTLVMAPTTSTTSGTYTVADGVITQMPLGAAPSSSDYCVKGTTLTVSPHADSTMPSMENATGSITLAKL